ncbi:MAG: metal-dependent transcriptional regulator [Eggerthellaceae bacterium]|nr:metal-dependent transcriptional regulator [Eggerthellaceae bacterium]MDR2715737.1 metal-dependent transcriptional regulator [Coriobacteriaceae bacterium]
MTARHEEGKEREKRPLTPANEDYLEAILELGGAAGAVRLVDLAARLGVSKASVSGALKNLKQAGFAEQPFYGGITLTGKGAEYASGIFERHQMLYHFLSDVLGVEPTRAADEACRMEHAISDDTLKRLTAYLTENLRPAAIR